MIHVNKRVPFVIIFLVTESTVRYIKPGEGPPNLHIPRMDHKKFSCEKERQQVIMRASKHMQIKNQAEK